ncbi:hypothetical protein Ait01nite_069550 [Actinoplanes italicus]|uniref:Uncharacterized protein n=1 Tax=Actinoplanes italicus TaxID=113567 RepID=A0A2T0JY08_9ACTN|nr:hypothetical protein [Actinoplanes italicus]PRX13342.1 hypothetical protein CLV67_12554 [Actinoplanes italicus]GIE33910.1 hypothetical protein Ait01nite_069550 [Actinoplanes italicus]
MLVDVVKIEIDNGTYRDLTLIASAVGMTPGEAVTLLVERFRSSAVAPKPVLAQPEAVPIHAVYQGQRVTAEFDPETSSLTITSGPLSGKWFRSPSGAAKAVVEVLNPGVSPNRSGFDFWFVTETGKTLQSIRSRR